MVETGQDRYTLHGDFEARRFWDRLLDPDRRAWDDPIEIEKARARMLSFACCLVGAYFTLLEQNGLDDERGAYIGELGLGLPYFISAGPQLEEDIADLRRRYAELKRIAVELYGPDPYADYRMDPVFKKAWIEALRSGEYAQGHGKMYDGGSRGTVPTYCCLGVLCQIASDRGIVPETNWREYGLLRDPSIEAFGFGRNASDGQVVLPEDHSEYSLVHANDSAGLNFTEIADIIEKVL